MTDSHDRGSGVGPRPSYRLREEGVHAPAGGAGTFLLTPGENRVGSLPDSQVLLVGRGVSRCHAVLEVGEGELVLRDLESKNGTAVNGRPVHTARVRPGDLLGFGGVTLCLEEIDRGDAELGLVLAPAEGASPGPSRETSQLVRTTPAVTAGAGAGGEGGGGGVWQLAFPPGYVRGASAATAELHAQMQSLMQGDLPVLILGETGVGKEYVAQILHASSARCDGPFVAVNCAAIPADLLEAELFGVVKGAATGVSARAGTFQQAAGGTLFLDEIGDMDPALQAKLLRALQEKEVWPVGGSRVAVDVRVVSATNTDLGERMERGAFRRDLYYRLAGYVLAVPALRQRREDVPALIERFLRQAAAELGKTVRGVTVRALRTLCDYPWPGNVRELENEVRRLAYLCLNGQVVDSSMLPAHLHRSGGETVPEPSGEPVAPASSPPAAAVEDAVDDEEELRLDALEKRAIERALERSGGKLGRAADLLGISGDALRRRIRRHGLD